MAGHARLIATVGEDRVSVSGDNSGGGGPFTIVAGPECSYTFPYFQRITPHRH